MGVHGYRIVFPVKLLAVSTEKHPADQADERHKENQQKSTERQGYRALLFGLRPGNAKSSDKALNQEIQQFHRITRCSKYRARYVRLKSRE